MIYKKKILNENFNTENIPSLYLLDDRDSAIKCRELLKYSATLAQLKWSKTFNIPNILLRSIDDVSEYLENELTNYCNENTKALDINENDFKTILNIIRTSEVGKDILGSNVVLADDVEVIKLLKRNNLFNDILGTGKHLVIA